MSKRFRKQSASAVSVLLASSMLMTACGGGTPAEQPAAAPAKTDTAPAKSEPAAAPAAGSTEYDQALAGKFKGTKVTMFGPFTDADQVKFETSIKEFESKTGIDIQYEGSKEFEATISIRVDGGNAPDIADFPQPGLLGSFAKKGKVIDVNKVMDVNALKKNYNASWIDMATMDGPSGKIMAGVWNRSNVKSLVWYPKKQFDEAGYKVPKTWDEMLELSRQIAKDGDKAWNIGIESGAATGWAATDWIEDIMLRTTTPENYDKWVKGELPFTSPEVKKAVEKMGEIWLDDELVYGGRKSIVTTSFGDAPKSMFTNPAKSWLHRQGNFITSFFPNTAKAGVDYDWFYLPPIDPQYGNPVLVAGDIYAMFNDRPEVRAVLQFFSKGESIKTWVQSGGVIAPMNDASLDWYSTDVDRRMAKLVQEAKTLRFDGSDLMPGSVGAGTFWKGMTDYVSGTVDLDGALKEIQAGWNKK
ncbi:ABC transporter substrate-binding protein [Paenibacillus mucilaginosus]|uniref:Extracellular solute-binding protein, family 1 n=1 Tax=Paenibacillus mucilaginosus (strain KNP414) TaxID=1036673 RepID=F8FC86_PAEMK|nr:ABC transporter substrate-binding protein [Paenibacillus mucilaginosus]AEI44487.1 extracellular solute-binding protein, family 1 [Paenibacillus mucilaginosus KNP414]MCG7217512.1 ABC transporter substrate-binding protein [Paenibacillus mucilaginosus]WDM30909.1 carbohydrate ABC transporter substrate-binding protein [Paenibacillus mucilaginosus]